MWTYTDSTTNRMYVRIHAVVIVLVLLLVAWWIWGGSLGHAPQYHSFMPHFKQGAQVAKHRKGFYTDRDLTSSLNGGGLLPLALK